MKSINLSDLRNFVTEWDRRQSKKKYYNPHALPQYLEAVDLASVQANFVVLEKALRCHFDDRLFVFLLKRCGVEEGRKS